jgi:NAD+ diphosphatase
MQPPRLSRAAYDRVSHRREDPAWLESAWPRARVILLSPDVTTPVIRSSEVVRLDLREPSSVPPKVPRRFLGVVDEVPYFAVTVPAGAEGWAGLREVGATTDDVQAGLLTTAVALEQWHGRHVHCPRCGTPTEETQAGWTRTCPRDGSQHFPRTDPAVIMLVHDGADRCLLGRGITWAPGRFSTLAGFVEPGESVEAAVAREVLEETGVTVDAVSYVASQPWPFPSSLMLGFTARVAGHPPPQPDRVEVAEADWFTREQVRQATAWTDTAATPDEDAVLRGVSPPLSISRYLIDRWLAGGA